MAVTQWDTFILMEMGPHPFLKFVIPSFMFVSLFEEGVLEQGKLETTAVAKPLGGVLRGNKMSDKEDRYTVI